MTSIANNWLFLEARSDEKLKEQLAGIDAGWSRLSGPFYSGGIHSVWITLDRPVEKKRRRNIKKPAVIAEPTKEL